MSGSRQRWDADRYLGLTCPRRCLVTRSWPISDLNECEVERRQLGETARLALACRNWGRVEGADHRLANLQRAGHKPSSALQMDTPCCSGTFIACGSNLRLDRDPGMRALDGRTKAQVPRSDDRRSCKTRLVASVGIVVRIRRCEPHASQRSAVSLHLSSSLSATTYFASTCTYVLCF